MKKIAVLTILIAIAGISIPVSANAAQAIDFSIRFFDRRIYYAENDPIYVQITITNNSPACFRFKLADERVFSVDFDIRTVSNKLLEPADALIRKRTQYQQIFFREIAVEPGESFSFVEDLRDYVYLKQPGSFIVQARVYPELYRSTLAAQRMTNSAAANENSKSSIPAETAALVEKSAQIFESNRLNLSIRPPVIYGPDGVPQEMDSATGAALVRQKIPPDQVVEYMLIARQKSQWEKFFLYIDLETMLLARDQARKRQWLNESESGRRQMLIKYRQELQSATIDNDISTIPIDFTVERTSYTNTNGEVSVLQKFYGGNNWTKVKRYKYLLVQKDGIWSVVDYVVTNLWTE